MAQRLYPKQTIFNFDKTLRACMLQHTQHLFAYLYNLPKLLNLQNFQERERAYPSSILSLLTRNSCKPPLLHPGGRLPMQSSRSFLSWKNCCLSPKCACGCWLSILLSHYYDLIEIGVVLCAWFRLAKEWQNLFKLNL